MDREMTIYKGFADDTSYNCSDCQHKCCVDPYPIGLLPSEATRLLQVHPVPQVMPDTRGLPIFRIYRASKCPYFSKEGTCVLHDPQLQHKPLSCILYPLIFWNFAENEWLAIIEPCSDGFRWWDGTPISMATLRETIELSRKKLGFLPKFLGDIADPEFPYAGITETRVRQELEMKAILSSSMRPFRTMVEYLEKNESRLSPLRLKQLNIDELLRFEDHLIQRDSFWCQKFIHALKNVSIWLGFSATYMQFKQVHSTVLRLIAVMLQLSDVIDNISTVINALGEEAQSSTVAWRFIDEKAWMLPPTVSSEYWKEKISSGQWKSLLKRKTGSKHVKTVLKRAATPIKMQWAPVWKKQP